MSTAEVDVIIIGAGAAGIGAAKTAGQLGLSFKLVEASHRIGGRAYTEEVQPGIKFDLGCHWMHSASLNPFVQIADSLGFHYSKDHGGQGAFVRGQWLDEHALAEFAAYEEACEQAITRASTLDHDQSVYDVIDNDSPWAPIFHQWISVLDSVDCDQVSIKDSCTYNNTHEDWPVHEGYGDLIQTFGSDLPVELNTQVLEVHWGGEGVRVLTVKGELHAKTLIMTVSNGVLSAGDIRFVPELPSSKLDAIAGLPLGHYNYACLQFDRDPVGPDCPQSVNYWDGDSVAVLFEVCPTGYPYIIATTGGRQAEWLERAGTSTIIELAKETAVKTFGSSILEHYIGETVTAWSSDPWVKGAYSAALPGQSHQREVLAETLDKRLLFAGEATSRGFHATAHGAYLTGIARAKEVAELLARAA